MTIVLHMEKLLTYSFLQALLCGIFIMCPEDPLKFLEEKIREIMEKGLDGILWYVSNILHMLFSSKD